MIDPRVAALCQEFGVEIIDRNRYPEPGQTRAVVTIRRILDRYGEAHARLIMSTLKETANNQVLLDEVGLWATSDLIRAMRKHHPEIMENRLEEWFETWDAAPVGELQFLCQDLSGITPQRGALVGLVYERLYRRFGPNAAQLDLLDDRRRA